MKKLRSVTTSQGSSMGPLPFTNYIHAKPVTDLSRPVIEQTTSHDLIIQTQLSIAKENTNTK